MEKIEPKLECEHLVPEIKNEIVEDEPIMPNITENGPEIYVKPEGGCDENENSPSCSRDSTSSSRRKRRLDEVDCNIDIDHIYCPKIPKIFKNKSERYRSGNNYECPDCPFITNKRQNFAKHVKNHTTKNGKKCAHCSFRSTKSGIMSHELIHEKMITNNGRKTHMEHFQLEHNISISKMNQSIRVNPILDKDFIVNNGVIKNESTLETDLMQIKSETAENCVIDTKIPRKFNESVNRISSKKNGYRIIMDTNGTRWLKCLAEDCPYKTKMLSSLKAHRIFHKHKGSLKCQYCSFQCKAQVELTWHLLQHVEQQNDKGNVKPDRTFCKVDKVEHDTVGKKSHKKSVMQKRYLNSSLKYHKKSRQYYYQCPDCPFKNKKPTNFSKHFVKHKKTSGKKCFYCTFRGTELEVKEHKLIHKQQISKCDLCNIKFRKRLGFERHRVLKHAISKSEHSHCIDTNDVIDKNNKNNTEDDIIAVILKEESSKSCRDHDLEDERSLLVLTNARRESINQSNENCDKESDGIKAVLLKKDSCSFYNDNKEIVNESLEHSIKNSKEPCDDDTENENINNQTITITITTSSNVNGSDLIKQALVDEILKTFQVSKVQELSGESQHSSNDETIVVSDILKSSVIAKEQDGSDGPNVDCLDQVNTQKSFKSYIEGMVVEIAAHHENGDREGESDNIPNHINENVVMEIAADHENEDRGGGSDNIPNHINEDVVIETVADHENGDSGGGSDNIPNHINENVVMEIAADHENGDRVAGSDNIPNHINEDVVIETVADHENGDSGCGSDNIPNHINENVVMEIATDHENGDRLAGSDNIPNHINEDVVIETVADHENGDSGCGSDNIPNHINENVVMEIAADHENGDRVGGCDNIPNHINKDVVIEIVVDHENGDSGGGSDNIPNHINENVVMEIAADHENGDRVGGSDNHINKDVVIEIVADHENGDSGGGSDNIPNHINENVVMEIAADHENGDGVGGSHNIPNHINEDMVIEIVADHENGDSGGGSDNILNHINEDVIIEIVADHENADSGGGSDNILNHINEDVIIEIAADHENVDQEGESDNVLNHNKDENNQDANEDGVIIKQAFDILNSLDQGKDLGDASNVHFNSDFLNTLTSLGEKNMEPCHSVNDEFERSLNEKIVEENIYISENQSVLDNNQNAQTSLDQCLSNGKKCDNEESSDNSTHISSLDNSNASSKSKYIKCVDLNCAFKTEQLHDLRKHLKYHRRKGVFKCGHCTFSSPVRLIMSIHMQEHFEASKSTCKKDRELNAKGSDKDLNGKPLEGNIGNNENESNLEDNSTSVLPKGSSIKCIDVDCPFRTNHMWSLKNHMSYHRHEGPFKCRRCTFNSTLRTTLVKHMRQHLDIPNLLYKKDSSNNNLNAEILEVSTDNWDNISAVTLKVSDSAIPNCSKYFKCIDADCPYMTNNVVNLKSHSIYHREKAALKCQHCTFSVTSQANMSRHLRAHIRALKSLHKDQEPGNSNDKDNSNILEPSSGNENKSATDNLNASYLDLPTSSADVKCLDADCPYKTKDKSRLKTHMTCHHQKGTFKCLHCTFSGSHRTSLVKHMKAHNDAIKSVRKGSKDPYDYNDIDLHGNTLEDSTDNNENNTSVTSKNRVVFECFDAKCPYKTRDKLCLKRHLQLHRQEGSFMCQYCTFRAENRIAMTKHMQLHSAFPDDLESYYTTIKQKSEQLKSTKSFVARTESGPKNNATSVPEDPFESWIFQCTYCPTKFPEEYLLKGHIKLHSSTKGIRCPICTYRHSKTEIIKHLSWHVASGKGPFTCPICDLNKRTKESMHDHLKVVHSEAIYRKHDSVCKSKVCNGICRKQGAE